MLRVESEDKGAAEKKTHKIKTDSKTISTHVCIDLWMPSHKDPTIFLVD